MKKDHLDDHSGKTWKDIFDIYENGEVRYAGSDAFVLIGPCQQKNPSKQKDPFNQGVDVLLNNAEIWDPLGEPLVDIPPVEEPSKSIPSPSPQNDASGQRGNDTDVGEKPSEEEPPSETKPDAKTKQDANSGDEAGKPVVAPAPEMPEAKPDKSAMPDAPTPESSLDDGLEVSWPEPAGEEVAPAESTPEKKELHKDMLNRDPGREMRPASSSLPDEIGFLKRFVEYTRRCGYEYPVRDLVRFHTSVKCWMCTLLSGAPGTGKSSLAELYFRALGGKGENREEDETFRRVDVNPSWMEPEDLLGYRNADGKYVPAGNGLYKFLDKARWNKTQLFPVCLEEINLACVEHYFSDFIQILSRGGGVIKVADGLAVGSNVRFVGTCNSDETTHSMSPRFLDRCNLIELGFDEDREKALIGKSFGGSRDVAKPQMFEEGDGITTETYAAWLNSGQDAPRLDKLGETLSGLLVHFRAAGVEPSLRVISEIAFYVRHRPRMGDELNRIDSGECAILALDEGIAQRILPLYRGTPFNIAAMKKLEEELKNCGFTLAAAQASRLHETCCRQLGMAGIREDA